MQYLQDQKGDDDDDWGYPEPYNNAKIDTAGSEVDIKEKNLNN